MNTPFSNDTITTVLFDLDGTLADTGPDLANALNKVLAEQHQPTLPYDRIRPHVSHGANAMLKLGFGLEPDHDHFPPLRERFLAIYHDNIARHTRLFPGMDTVLDTLEARQLRWGVVTNKPGWLTEPLMRELGLAQRAACIVSGDTTTHRKPHPEPMLYACRITASRAPQCLYVGDARRDIEAGRRAGMATLAALFGYIGDDDPPEQWGADDMIEHPEQILEWLAIN